MNRTLRWFWPKAESVLYEEPKKLVARGLATANREYTGRRAGTRYAITTAGRAALRDWLDEPGCAMSTEFEALMQVAFADHGDRTQLLRTLGTIRADGAARLAEVHPRGEAYVEVGGPFPDRLPVIALINKFLLEQAELLERWAGWAESVVTEWPGVTPETGATVPPEAFSTGWPPRAEPPV